MAELMMLFGGRGNLMVLNSYFLGGQPLGPLQVVWVNCVLLWMSATYYSFRLAHASVLKGKHKLTHTHTSTCTRMYSHTHFHSSLNLNSKYGLNWMNFDILFLRNWMWFWWFLHFLAISDLLLFLFCYILSQASGCQSLALHSPELFLPCRPKYLWKLTFVVMQVRT